MNNVQLIGRLTKDPELKATSTGTMVCNFSIAVNDMKDEVNYIACTAFNKTAEMIAEKFFKGKQIAIDGRLKQNRWVDTDGKNKSSLYVIVAKVTFVGSSGSAGSVETNNTSDVTFEEVTAEDVPF